MTIHVRFFAIIRDKAGRRELVLDLPDESSVEAAVQQLGREVPAIEPYLQRCAFAVNQSYASLVTPLIDDDELAIIPPVSGG